MIKVKYIRNDLSRLFRVVIENLNNLYFAGAGTHPRAGLSGVLSSAKIAENLIRGV